MTKEVLKTEIRNLVPLLVFQGCVGNVLPKNGSLITQIGLPELQRNAAGGRHILGKAISEFFPQRQDDVGGLFAALIRLP